MGFCGLFTVSEKNLFIGLFVDISQTIGYNASRSEKDCEEISYIRIKFRARKVSFFDEYDYIMCANIAVIRHQTKVFIGKISFL